MRFPPDIVVVIMTKPSRAPHVHKFGGASLADAGAVRHAVSILLDHRPEPAVVVVSAMAGVTDALLAMAADAVEGDESAVSAAVARLRSRYTAAAKALIPAGDARSELGAAIDTAFDELEALARGLGVLGELTHRTTDHFAARGEYLSARLVAAALTVAGARARFVDPLEVIHTDGTFGGAAPDFPRTDRRARALLRPMLARGVIPVVPGFVGATPSGDLATLGRGGSDLTATLIGRALQAERVSLWKDVPGFLTADPRVVPDARVIPQMHAREAAELAYYGAKVLHPRALIPLAGRGIPLQVRPFADPSSRGTEVSERRIVSRSPVRALSASFGQSLVMVTGNGMLGVPGIAARTFEALHSRAISVSLISQASSEHSICFSVPEGAAERARAALTAEFQAEIGRREIDGVEVQAGVATVAVVGLGMAGTRGVAARVFSAVAHGGINVVAIAQGSSELNISFVVDAEDAREAQRLIHDTFQLAKIGGGEVVRPERMSVVVLGFGQVGRTLAALLSRVSQPHVSLEIAAVIDRSGFVFDPRGIGPRRLAALAAEKRGGKPLAQSQGGRSATSLEAIDYIARHALVRPILVDVTADDTRPILRSALAGGMNLVLANKRPLTERGQDTEHLKQLARSCGRRVLFEATVGAGLPIVDTCLKLVESGDRVARIDGCLSGTLGYLLSEMERGRRFSDVLREARELGYTEPDPRDDLAGVDVARKALILAQLLGFEGGLECVGVQSLVPRAARSLPLSQFLDQLPKYDGEWERRIAEARAQRGVLRYVASVTTRHVAVGLAAVDPSSPFGALRGTDNQVVFTTARYKNGNPLVITGPGAGLEVTAAGVMNDILALAPP